MKSDKDKGFTTIELMTVIVIAAVLLVIAVPGFLIMSNRSAVTATANELVGLIQFAKNNAKIANKPTVLKPCATTANCNMEVIYAEDSGSTDGKNLRVITFPKKINFSAGDSASTDEKKSIAFYADGTRGIHAANTNIKKFESDGSFERKTINLGSYAQGAVTWEVSAGNKEGMGYYCRAITISMMGDAAIKEGCD